MPIRIAMAGQKGGSKKSATARALGTAFAGAGLSVLIADFDPKQKTCAKWNMRRQARFPDLPEIMVKPYVSVAQAMREIDQYDVVIFDPGAFASEIMMEAAGHAHCVILPTAAGLDDLEPSVDLANDLALRGVDPQRIAFALHPAGDSESELIAARTYLGQTPYATLDGYIPQKTIYSMAHDLGLSVIEARSQGPRQKAEKLIQSAIDTISALTN
ncbi:ParA family protein [Pseudomonas mosselii]|uniref:ParA family protein n=1 Tax=Pseudomonas mosselii TaxID=78327 RepID=UPI0018D9625B|nr:ParA family protein [Pseudomonas mosselii]MBH3307950.1 ParA family protein [Pseudomonas mosselii]MBH3326560.1 ParA family protein [Pseudomonas mosselii]